MIVCGNAQSQLICYGPARGNGNAQQMVSVPTFQKAMTEVQTMQSAHDSTLSVTQILKNEYNLYVHNNL